MSGAATAFVIPQTDPRAGYLAERIAIDAAIARVLDGGAYILGREVEIFEAAFADFVGVAHAVTAKPSPPRRRSSERNTLTASRA